MRRQSSYGLSSCSPVLSLCVLGLLLTACSSVEERQARVLNIVGGLSGAESEVLDHLPSNLEEAKGQVRGVVERVNEGVGSIHQRIQKVQAGFQSFQKGLEAFQDAKEHLEGGLGVEREEAVEQEGE